MTRDDLIRMARETCGGDSPFDDDGCCYMQPSELDRFAELVAATEREQCAMLCDEMHDDYQEADQCAKAIRARGAAAIGKGE